MTEQKKQHKVVMLPRSLLIAWLISYVIIIIMFIVSMQYANYIDRKSNRAWCGIVLLFNETYEKNPPPTEIGKMLEAEFKHLRTDFRCT
jgi:hypothetical protein